MPETGVLLQEGELTEAGVHTSAISCDQTSPMPAALPFVEPEFRSPRLPRYLTQEDVRAFLSVIDKPRDKALFAFIYLYALRVGEVALHRRSDVDFARHRIVLKRRKGGLWTERPLFSRMEELFHEAGIDDAPQEAPIFPGQRGPLRKRQIQALFTKYRDLANIPRRYTCHSLRHGMATHLLDAGEAVAFVQDHLGHRDVRSTLIYARITDQNRAAAFARVETSPWVVQPYSGSAGKGAAG